MCTREPSFPPSVGSLRNLAVDLDVPLRESPDVGAEYRDQVGPMVRLKHYTPQFERYPLEC
jgi:hypothetical protein